MFARTLLHSLLTATSLPLFALTTVAASPSSSADDARESAKLREWIDEMKASPKGPFQAIRWFCRDGTHHPAKPYPCAERGGGIQHGLWSDRAAAMREDGYAIANLLADVDPAQFTGDAADVDTLSQILLERFLMRADDGWIFRGAFGYRGAFQIEDEEAGAAALVDAMMLDPRWRTAPRHALARETVRLLPLQSDSVTASKVRQLAIDIANVDAGFAKLRAKIHGAPDAGDAARVREHAHTRGKPEAAAMYDEIALAIDALYASEGAVDALRALANRSGDPGLAQLLRTAAEKLAARSDPAARFAAASELMASLRRHFQTEASGAGGLELVEASLALEREAYAAGNTLLARLANASRRERLRALNASIDGLYGAGFLSLRQFAALRGAINAIVTKREISVAAYRDTLRYLARVPEWSARWLDFHFSSAVTRFSRFEPLAHLYSQDRLRGSPLLFYGAVLDGLVLDANVVAGVRGELFGASVGAGLRALNPGLARGVIREARNDDGGAPIDRSGIYLLPETTSDLPPVSGILTRGEGSSLSHVQLLARNLGIPNVVVSDALLPSVRARVGQAAVLAVSPGGVVQLVADEPRFTAVFGANDQQADVAVEIRPDLEKLDLDTASLLPLSGLRASDSGRTSGPKGANLGELKHFFGPAVPDGIVIPFGVFRKLLDQPIDPGGPPLFTWMQRQYDDIARLDDRAEEQQRKVKTFLATVRRWISTADPGPAFRDSLRAALEQKFGPDGTYGVFVRSDTNVEDLAGFTGAGLNLTVFNVVGYDNILAAIREVWASPFTDRAYGWRQGNMSDPAYVFPAVVIQLAYPSEKSGVMVTTDVEGGVPGWVSIAISEGVGGAVDGQATESLRVDTKSGKIQLLAQATSPTKTVLLPDGGIGKSPASGTSAVLTRAEIDQLIALAADVSKFPSLRDEQGRPRPADIEFGFRDGQLALLQIRPFVESVAAQQNAYLQQLDAGLRDRAQSLVDLDGTPRG
ncbi:MAG: PEP/pyruvate-binding domain-containing protein [Myxococcota bacterium]